MGLPSPIILQKDHYRVYKTGLPFYDAARLIGVAHLFFGTASAEVEDKGAYWEVSGVSVERDKDQILWTVERLRPTDKERRLFEKDGGSFRWDELQSFFSTPPNSRKGRQEELKAEYDAALQIGTRGIDPLSKYEILAPRSTGETRKRFKDYFQEVAAATLGRAFAAYVVSRSKRQTDEIYILPIFRERFVISGFLTYERTFQHPGGGWVAAVMAALSILLDLTAKRLPVVDFAYTREVKGPTRQPIFSSSGYLGLERLCAYWWNEIVEKENEQALRLLRNFRQFLQDTDTRGQNVNEQVQHLARWVAEFVANPSVDGLVKIEQLKARILAASQSQNLRGALETRQLLGYSQLLQEVKNMMSMQLPEIPWQVAEALARALGFDEKGWMNQFTRLENAGNFSQFIQQVEHIVSRGFYREQQEQGQPPNIREALTRARDLANILRGIEAQLRDEKAFRAWKAIFLLEVLSRARFQKETSAQAGAQVEPAETQEPTQQ